MNGAVGGCGLAAGKYELIGLFAEVRENLREIDGHSWAGDDRNADPARIIVVFLVRHFDDNSAFPDADDWAIVGVQLQFVSDGREKHLPYSVDIVFQY